MTSYIEYLRKVGIKLYEGGGRIGVYIRERLYQPALFLVFLRSRKLKLNDC